MKLTHDEMHRAFKAIGTFHVISERYRYMFRRTKPLLTSWSYVSTKDYHPATLIDNWWLEMKDLYGESEK